MDRLFCLAKNIALSNFKELKFPYRFTYILTYRCQFKCAMCNIWKKSIKNELSLEQIERFFDRSNHFSWINLSGGEIFLRKDLPDIIEIMLEKCKHLYLLDFPTNGFETKLIFDVVKKITTSHNLPKLLVTISLDGPPELHDHIRNTPGSWDRAIETFTELRKLKSGKFNVFFGMTLQQDNAEAYEKMFRSVKEKAGRITHDDFHVNIVHSSSHYYGNPDLAKFKNKEIVWYQLRYIYQKRKNFSLSPIAFLEKRYQELSKIFLDTGKNPLPCQALCASFFMDPSGMVYPCSMYDKPIGNITDFAYNIKNIWESNSRRELRNEVRKGNCPHCWTPCEAYQSIFAELFPKLRG